MSEHESEPGWSAGWSPESLRLHLMRQMADLRDYVDARLAASEKAVDKAERSTDQRFHAVNEFRAQLADQAARFIPRTEYDAAHEALIEKLEAATTNASERLREVELRLTSRLDTSAGRRVGLATGWSAFIAASSVLVSIVAIVITIAIYKP